MSAPLLSLPTELWTSLIQTLASRGGGVRESGAFLLGRNAGSIRYASSLVLYDQLSPSAFNRDFVHLDGAAFAKLWDICAARSLEVVADIHTHRGMPGQSISDRANPMVAMVGHVALIVPHYAQGKITPSDLGVHKYLGSGRWTSWFRADAAKCLRIGEV